MSEEMVIMSKEKLVDLFRTLLNEAALKEREREADRDEYMTFGEVCKFLKISTSTLNRLKAEDKIPYRKIGGCIRFKRSELDEASEKSNYYKLGGLK